MFTRRPTNWRMRAASAAALASVLVLSAVLAAQPGPSAPGGGVDVRVRMWSLSTSVAPPSLPDDAPQRIHQLAEQLYPPALRSAGTGGTVAVEFTVLPSGAVDGQTVRVVDPRTPGEGFPQLAEASAALVRRLAFEPGPGAQVRMVITWIPG